MESESVMEPEDENYISESPTTQLRFVRRKRDDERVTMILQQLVVFQNLMRGNSWQEWRDVPVATEV